MSLLQVVNGAPRENNPAIAVTGNTERRLLLLCLLAVLCIAAAGCGRAQQVTPASADGYAVTLSAQPMPPVVGAGTLVITIQDQAGGAVERARLEIEGNMNHAGMIPSFGKITSEGAGRYTAALTWTMAGDWYVDVKATLADGQVIRRRFPITVNGK